MTMTLAKALLIHPADNVAVALEDIPQGSRITIASPGPPYDFTVQEFIPFAHKVAVKSIARGESVTKYGAPVARMFSPVEAGAWVHTHNAESQYVKFVGGVE
jgi:hypothetical protein